jgi:hypothetical protein
MDVVTLPIVVVVTPAMQPRARGRDYHLEWASSASS